VTPALVSPPVPGVAASSRWLLRRLGDPVRLAESDAAVADRLARHGFVHRSVSDPTAWAQAAGVRLRGPRLAEHLHVAVRDVR
jgi:hypothetical protein